MINQKTRRLYTREFKEQALALLAAGRPVSELAQELGVSSNLLYCWRQAQRAQGGSAGQGAAGELAGADDLRALRRELALLRAENDILKKAAVILGTRAQNTCAK